MDAPNQTINLDEIYAALDNELDDLYHDGIISSSIYNKKNQRRMLLWAISAADRHICLRMKRKSNVEIFVPADQKVIYFSRQKEYLSERYDEYSDIKDDDTRQYALMVAENMFLDIISVVSPYAHVYSKIPLAGEVPSEVIDNALISDSQTQPSRRYVVTGGSIKTEVPLTRRFYSEPESRKMVLSKPYGSDKWIQCIAQIAPIQTSITGLTKSELECYQIVAPYYARQWLITRAMIHLLSTNAANAGGYFDTEAKFESEAFANKPGTGNVVIPGDELDGNYEADFNDF